MPNVNEYLTPNDEVLNSFLVAFGDNAIEIIKANKMSKFDLAITLVKAAVKIAGIEKNVAFDLMFGEGSYDKFMQATHDELKARLA